MCGVDSDWQRGQTVPQQELDQKKDTAFKVFCKFNRNDLQKISGVGKEEPKTTGEEYQNLGILTGHRRVLLSFLSLVLPSLQGFLPAHSGERWGAGGAGREKALNANLTGSRSLPQAQEF